MLITYYQLKSVVYIRVHTLLCEKSWQEHVVMFLPLQEHVE